MEKKKALAYKKFVLEAEAAFNLIVKEMVLLDNKELKRLKRKFHPDEFENTYIEFEEELRENCLNFKNFDYIKLFLRSVFQDVARWCEPDEIIIENIIKNDFEIEFLLKLHENINYEIKRFNLFSQQPFDSNIGKLQNYYQELIQVPEKIDTEESEDSIDPRFDIDFLKSEIDKPEFTVSDKLKMVNQRLFDFLQWQKQYDIYDEWAIYSSESKYIITNKLYPKFEALCRLEIERWESMVGNNEEKNKYTQAETAKTPLNFKITSKRKTDVIKILSAMYDCRMFVDTEGNAASNKQKLMDAFGEFLGEDFSAYSTLLSQAKDKGINTFMKPLRDLEREFNRYINFTVNE